MLEEVIKYNYLVPFEEMLMFFQNTIGERNIDKKSLKLLSSQVHKYTIDIEEVVSLGKFAGIITESPEEILSLEESLLDLIDKDKEFKDLVIKNIVEASFKTGVLSSNLFSFDYNGNRIMFHNEMLSLKYSGIRNILIAMKILYQNRKQNYTEFIVEEEFQDYIESVLKKNIEKYQLKSWKRI